MIERLLRPSEATDLIECYLDVDRNCFCLVALRKFVCDESYVYLLTISDASYPVIGLVDACVAPNRMVLPVMTLGFEFCNLLLELSTFRL